MYDNAIRTPNAPDAAKRQHNPDLSRSIGDHYSSREQGDDIAARHSGARDDTSRPASPAPGATAGEESAHSLEMRGVRELRIRARNLRIHNRSKMNKHELIEAIRAAAG